MRVGPLLTLGVGTCLLVSIVLVPAILTWITRRRGATGAAHWLPEELPERHRRVPEPPRLGRAQEPEPQHLQDRIRRDDREL